MQAPFGAPTPPTLAVCGWTERTPALLRALEAHHLTPVAIGDPSAMALATAALALRGRLFSPARYQHPREMLRRGPGATVLLDLPDAAAEAAAAAQRGTAVLVTGDAIEPQTLDMLARTGATAAILRPLWSRATIATALDAARCLSRLRAAIVTVEEPRAARAIADDLVALAARLVGEPVRSMTASAYGSPRGTTESIVTELEFASGCTMLLVARSTLDVRVEVELSSSTTTIEASGDDSGGTLTISTGVHITTTTIIEADPHALAVDEALAELAAGGVEADHLFAEAALLRALDNTLDYLPDHSFEGSSDGMRQHEPRLSLIPCSGQTSEPRRGHLRLVGV